MRLSEVDHEKAQSKCQTILYITTIESTRDNYTTYQTDLSRTTYNRSLHRYICETSLNTAGRATPREKMNSEK